MKIFKNIEEPTNFYIYDENKNTLYSIWDTTTNQSDLLLGMHLIFDFLGNGVCTPSHLVEMNNKSIEVLSLKEVQQILKGTDFKGKYVKITNDTVNFDSFDRPSLEEFDSDLYEVLLRRFIDEVKV